MSNDDTPHPAELIRWLTAALDADASDLHLVVGHPPVIRVHGALMPLREPELEGAALREILLAVAPEIFATSLPPRTIPISRCSCRSTVSGDGSARITL